jgi:DNA mismatch endonuclease, patch repair protein
LAESMAADKRSALMARVRTRNTGPEMIVRRAIHAAGLRFRLHRKDLAGKPDIVMSGLRSAVFVHGCFWHSHDCAKGRSRPKSNIEFWTKKLDRNAERDRMAQSALANDGWFVEVIWECEIEAKVPSLVERLKRRREDFRA